MLAGTTIGDDIVIGAGAVASGNLRGVVYGGIPAKPICTIEDYYGRRKKRRLPEAPEVWRRYVARFGRDPGPNVYHGYFYLFTRSSDDLLPAFRRKFDDHGSAQECLDYLAAGKNEAPLASFEEFAAWCREQLRKESLN